MFLSKHKNGYYYVYYFDAITNLRKSISTKKKIKKDALNFLTSFSREIELTRQNKIIPITLNKFFWNFLIYSEAVHSINTTNTFKTSFRSIIKYFGDVQISKMTTSRISEYLEYKIRTVSKYQARKDLINLSSAFKKAVTDGYIIFNPCVGIKRIKIPEKQPLFFRENEFHNLLEVIDNVDLKDITIFAVNTGLRRMELITLQWEQINFRDKLVTLDNRNHLTKSKKIRTIPLNIHCMQILIERERYKTGSNVFTLDSKPISADKLTRLFKIYVKKTNVNQQLNFHSLRHTFASWLVQRGVSIYQVSRLLGHSDIKITEVYAHLRAEDLRDTVDLL